MCGCGGRGPTRKDSVVRALPCTTNHVSCQPCAYVWWAQVVATFDVAGRPGVIRLRRIAPAFETHVVPGRPTADAGTHAVVAVDPQNGNLSDTALSGAAEQLTEELLGSLGVSTRLDEDVEHHTVLVDRVPQVHPLAVDRDEHFIEVPLVARRACGGAAGWHRTGRTSRTTAGSSRARPRRRVRTSVPAGHAGSTRSGDTATRRG